MQKIGPRVSLGISVKRLVTCLPVQDEGFGVSAQHLQGSPRGSKYPMFKVSGLNIHSLYGFWSPETSNIGCLDPPGQNLLEAERTASVSIEAACAMHRPEVVALQQLRVRIFIKHCSTVPGSLQVFARRSRPFLRLPSSSCCFHTSSGEELAQVSTGGQ